MSFELVWAESLEPFSARSSRPALGRRPNTHSPPNVFKTASKTFLVQAENSVEFESTDMLLSGLLEYRDTGDRVRGLNDW